MKLGLEAMFNSAEVEQEVMKQADAATLSHLIQVGTRAVELSREKQGTSPYQDDTGNLRSSTGYIIFRNGKEVHRDFKLSPVGTDKATGLQTGIDAALQDLTGTTGWSIAFVAGMVYASWVESKGYNVLRKEVESGVMGWLQQAFNEIGSIS